MEYVGNPMHVVGVEPESLVGRIFWAIFRPLMAPMMGPIACLV
jgi:hypothetical protein